MVKLPLIMLVVLGIALVIAFVRKGKVTTITMGSTSRTLASNLTVLEAFDRLSAGVASFRVEDISKDMSAILLTNGPTLGTWGFFYPVVISPSADGGSLIQIGIRSRIFQLGPLVTKWHRKCVAEIEDALGGGALPTARVV